MSRDDGSYGRGRGRGRRVSVGDGVWDSAPPESCEGGSMASERATRDTYRCLILGTLNTRGDNNKTQGSGLDEPGERGKLGGP